MKAKTITIDAKGKILGRLATQVCNALRGKNDADFSYNVVKPIKVIVYNAKEIKVSGNKIKQKKYYRHSGRLGNLKEISFEKVITENPSKVVFLAIKNMLPKNRLQQLWLNNLTIKNGDLDAKE
jgi:large subunit ribosomal protein L13